MEITESVSSCCKVFWRFYGSHHNSRGLRLYHMNEIIELTVLCLWIISKKLLSQIIDPLLISFKNQWNQWELKLNYKIIIHLSLRARSWFVYSAHVIVVMTFSIRYCGSDSNAIRNTHTLTPSLTLLPAPSVATLNSIEQQRKVCTLATDFKFFH